jgi:hypothetical protein
MLNMAVSTWQQCLQDLDGKLVLNVAMKICMTDLNDFAPKPAFLRKECLKVLNPNDFISAEKAWEMVSSAVKRYGNPNEELAMRSFNNTIRRAVNSLGGWQKICATPIGKEWDYLRKDFVKIYSDYDIEEKPNKLLPETVLTRLQELKQQKAIE